MPRIIEGHGFLMTRNPPSFGLHGVPSRLTTSGNTPKNGLVQLPGFVAVMPGTGEIMIAPVSVCHQVSTMGHRPPPMTSWYHIQASGLIGSPTLPSSRRLLMLCRFGYSVPHRTKARIAVG